MNAQTKIIKSPFQKPDAHGALAMPVYYSAAFEFPSAKAMSDAFCGRSPSHSYSRISNPTVAFLEDRVKTVTGAISVTALTSGMAAISYSLLAVSAAGLNIVASKHLFGNSVSLMRDTLGGLGVEVRFVDFRDINEVAAAIDDKTCAVFFEIITNPQLFVTDIRAVARLAHDASAPVIADTTIIPFTEFSSRELGVDIEVVSSTKYVSGGGTGLGGLLIDNGIFDWSKSHTPALKSLASKVSGRLALTARVNTELLTNVGAIMTPQVAYMETLGLEALSLRYRQQSQSAFFLAQHCQSLPGISRVNYAALDGNPYKELVESQFHSLPGAVFTIDVASPEAAFSFIDHLSVIHRATNLFDNRSLAIHPASTIFGRFTPAQREAMGVLDTTIRLSIGLEDPQDLLADIAQALNA